jgi:hypothetical protein
VVEEDVPDHVFFHISAKYKAILTQLVNELKSKIAYGRPALLDYFTDEYEKIKIAEALAFCGDVGSYFIGLTNLRTDIKDIFIELLKLSGTVISKASTKTVLKEAEQKFVRLIFFVLHI